MAKTVKGYARFRSVDAKADAEKRQLKIKQITEFVLQHPEWELASIEFDIGCGSKLNERPSIQKLLRECKEGKVQVLLFDRMESITRSSKDAVKILKPLLEHGVELWSVIDGSILNNEPDNILGRMLLF